MLEWFAQQVPQPVPKPTVTEAVAQICQEIFNPKRGGRSIISQISEFCNVVQRNQKESTAQEIDSELHRFTTMRDSLGHILPKDADITNITADTVRRLNAALEQLPISGDTRKKRWGIFKRFVGDLASEELIPLPSNLYSKKYSFRVQCKPVIRHPIEKVREVLGSLSPRNKLFCLMGLNFGMTNVDIARLEKTAVNGFVLTRKRVKTEDHVNVPVVQYQIWAETYELLSTHKSCHESLWLLCREGKKLVEWHKNSKGKWIKRDRLSSEYREDSPKLHLKNFRSIAATIIRDHSGSEVASLFLGHAPVGILDRHYAAAPQERLNQALLHLRDVILCSNSSIR